LTDGKLPKIPHNSGVGAGTGILDVKRPMIENDASSSIVTMLALAPFHRVCVLFTYPLLFWILCMRFVGWF
jgi:hypothetical protein